MVIFIGEGHVSGDQTRLHLKGAGALRPHMFGTPLLTPIWFYLERPNSIFLYGSECWVITKEDARRINALHQWCLRMLLGIKWYHFISNDEVRRQTNQPLLTEIIQARHLTLFGHIARMDDNVDAKQILTSSPFVNWKRPPGRPRMTWLKTVQNDLDSGVARL